MIERIRRSLAAVSDFYSHTVEPVSTQFGHAFGCEDWAVKVGGWEGVGWGCPGNGVACPHLGFHASCHAALHRGLDWPRHRRLTARPCLRNERVHALRAPPPSVQLFPEEVVRGGPAFAVSLVLTSIEPRMRAAAELGAWQVRQASEALSVERGTCLLACRAARTHQAAAGQPPLISAAGFLPSFL